LSKPGSAGAGILVSALIVASLVAIGYYQFEIAPNSATSSSVTTTVPSNIKTVRVNMTIGASTKTTDAFAPNPLRLVIGKNNSVIFHNGDIQAGVGTPHTATATMMVGGKPVFDTGILMAGDDSGAVVFNTPGTINYFCEIHPIMRGTIVVVAGP